MLKEYCLKLPKAVYDGENAMQKLALILDDTNKKVALFTSSEIISVGLCDEAIGVIKSLGKEVTIDSKLPAEPTYTQVQETVNWFRASGADCILAIGGGSVMDAAKLASILATDEYSVKDLLDNPKLAKKQVKSIMVPTTAGTGAETTPNAIVAVPEKDLKVGIVNDDMIADAIILDDKMIAHLPRKIAASTGLDTLCHAIECFTSNKANPISDAFALDALELTVKNLETACDDPDAVEAKRAMQLASFFGGIAITASGTTAVHALSYPLGGRYHVAHGVSNAILLMPVMRFNLPAIKDRLACAYERCIAGGATTTDEKANVMLERMNEIVEHLNMPKKLEELGVKDAPVDELVEAGMQVQRLLVNNAREVTPADAKAIYEQIL